MSLLRGGKKLDSSGAESGREFRIASPLPPPSARERHRRSENNLCGQQCCTNAALGPSVAGFPGRLLCDSGAVFNCRMLTFVIRMIKLWVKDPG